jgi:lysophospholipase L1-like esterase
MIRFISTPPSPHNANYVTGMVKTLSPADEAMFVAAGHALQIADPVVAIASTLTQLSNGDTVVRLADRSVRRITGNGPGSFNWLLAGDSMVDQTEMGVTAATAVSYSSATGVLTCTSANHFRASGEMARFWNFNYASTRAAKRSPITRVDVNTYTLQLNPAEHLDLPNGPLLPTLFVSVQGTTSYTHPMGLALMKLGQRFNIVFNGAQNGDTSTNFLDRLPALLAAWPEARNIYWQALGLNDQAGTWNIPERTSIAANRQSIRLMAQAADLCIIATTTPVASGEARASNAAMQRIRNINASVIEEASKYPNCVPLDFYTPMVDVTNVDGYGPAANFRNDFIHYGYTGADRIVDSRLVPALKARAVPSPRSPLVSSAAECHLNSRLSISSVTRAADGMTVTVTTTAAHNWRPTDDFHVTRISAAENGRFMVLDTPSSLQIRYLHPGVPGVISAGGAHYTRCRQAFQNPLLLISGGAAPANGLSGTTADVALGLRVSNQAGNTGTLTCAASLVAAVDGPELPGIGNMQQLLVTAAAALDRPAIYNNGSSALLNDLLPNQWYRFAARVQLARVAGVWSGLPISEVYGMFTLTWSTGEFYQSPFISGWDGAEPITVKSDQDWVVQTPPISTRPPQPGSTITQADWGCWPRIAGAITGGNHLAFRMGQITHTML